MSAINVHFGAADPKFNAQRYNLRDLSPGWVAPLGVAEMTFKITAIEKGSKLWFHKKAKPGKKKTVADPDKASREAKALDNKKKRLLERFPLLKISGLEPLLVSDLGSNFAKGWNRSDEEGKGSEDKIQREIKANSENVRGLGAKGKTFKIEIGSRENRLPLRRVWAVAADDSELTVEISPYPKSTFENPPVPSAQDTETSLLFANYKRGRGLCSVVGDGERPQPGALNFKLKISRPSKGSRAPKWFRVFFSTDSAVYGSMPIASFVERQATFEEGGTEALLFTEEMLEVDLHRVVCGCGCVPLADPTNLKKEASKTPGDVCLQWLARGLATRDDRLSLHKLLGKSKVADFRIFTTEEETQTSSKVSEKMTWAAGNKGKTNSYANNVSWRPLLPVSGSSVRNAVRTFLSLPLDGDEKADLDIDLNTNGKWRYRLLDMLNGTKGATLPSAFPELYPSENERKALWSKGGVDETKLEKNKWYAHVFPGESYVALVAGSVDDHRDLPSTKRKVCTLLERKDGEGKSIAPNEQPEPDTLKNRGGRPPLYKMIGLVRVPAGAIPSGSSAKVAKVAKDPKYVEIERKTYDLWKRERFGLKLWVSAMARAIATDAEREVFLLAAEMRTGYSFSDRYF